MGSILDLASIALRPFTSLGKANWPDKYELKQVFAEVDAVVADIRNDITTGILTYGTWAELLAKTDVPDGTGGEVVDADTGTHADATSTGYNGASVANAGRYRRNAAWNRWVRIGGTGLSSKVDLALFNSNVNNPNLLFDPFNEMVTDDPYAGGYGHWSGGLNSGAFYSFGGPAFTTSSANIPVATPVLTSTGASIDRYWLLKDLGINEGDTVTVGILVWYSAPGGTISLIARGADNSSLGVGATSGLSAGLQVAYATLTIPANTIHICLRGAHASAAAFEIAAYALTRGAQRPGFSRPSTPPRYSPSTTGELASSNILLDPFGELLSQADQSGNVNFLEDYFTGDGPSNTSASPLGFGQALVTSVNSPFGKGSIKAVYLTSAFILRRVIKLNKALPGVIAGDRVRLRLRAYFPDAGGTITISFRDVNNNQVNAGGTSGGQLYGSQPAGAVDFATRSFIVPANTDYIFVEVQHASSAPELLGVAVGRGGKPAWGPAAPSAAYFGRSRRQRNLAPDPFFRRHAAGNTVVDGYPVMQDVTPNVVSVSASPFKPKLGNLVSVSTACNRRVSARRMGLKLNDTVTIRQAIMFTNDSPTFGFGYNWRRTDGSVISTTAKLYPSAYFKAGAVVETLFTQVVTQAILDDMEYLELRYNTAGVAITGGYHLLGLGIYNGAEAPLLDYSSAAEDSLALDLYALQQQVVGLSTVQTPGSYRAKLLRETRMRITQRDFDETARIVHLAIGDSYTHNRDRYASPLLTRVQSRKNDVGNALGDGGGGWTGFASGGTGLDNGNARTTYAYSRSGTWSFAAYYTGGGPDLGMASSSTAGARLVLTKPASPVHADATLFWKNTADGVIRYSWDAGATWTSLNVQGTVGDLGTASLAAGMPVGAATLWVEVVSGTCQLFGLNWVSATSGYVLHKCGSTGSATTQWVAAAAALQQASWAALAPNLVSIMLGVNDNASPLSRAVYKANLEVMIQRVRAAVPNADIWLIMPAQTPRVQSVAMAEYAGAMYELAAHYGCCFTWLQDVFGDASNPTQYSSQGGRPWFADDGLDGLASTDIHPNTTTGSRAMVGDLFRTLFYYP